MKPAKTITCFLWVCLLTGVFFFCGCSRSQREPTVDPPEETEAGSQPIVGGRPVRIVATYSILGDWATIIGGEQVELTVLVGPGGDAQTYEPTPRDSVALATADILFENGLGFEIWLDRLFQASNSAARRVIVTENVKPRELTVSDACTKIDPHVWHLPDNAIIMIEAITSALEQADPAHATNYRDRQADYVLTERDRRILLGGA